MKTVWKKIASIVCVLTMLCTLIVLPVSAIEGGGLQNNSSSNVAFGCDLSFWNVGGSDLDHSLVDFNKMVADGCEFAILRIGFEGSSTGVDTLDTAFVQFYKNARAAGMDLGIYFYSHAKTYAGAVQDAQWVISQIEKYDMYFEYPIYYDIEESDQTALGSSAMNSLCLGWCETLEAAGYYPGIYGGMSQVITKLTDSFKATYDVWYPAVLTNGHGSQYSPYSRNYSDRCSMWQYSWYDYEYNGIGLDMLDVNVAYKDYPTIIQNGGWNNTAVRHKITFETNGGTAVDPVYVTDGTALVEPTSPTRWGFEFGGWYCNPELTDAYDFTTPVPYDFTLYAKWNEAYWGANTDLMPKEGSLTPRSYNDADEKLWPYWNSSTGACTMYSGVTTSEAMPSAWPSAYMLYANSFDATNDSYLYVKKDGNAEFNVELTYMDAEGNLHSIKASEILGLATTDFPEGYWEGFIDVAQYIKDQGHMTDSGNVKYTQVDYYVIGAKDEYVTLYECKLTPKFEIADPYATLMNSNISAQTGSGSYVYDNGVLTMNSTSASGYGVTLDINKTIDPTELIKLLVDINSTSDFNIAINASGANGACTINFNTEFFDRFGIENTGTAPEALPAGDWQVAMNLLGYFEWNGGAVSESMIDSVTVSMTGTGTLVLSALQASRMETVTYVEDGKYSAGSTTGGVVVPTELTSDIYVVSGSIVKRIPGETTLAEFLANIDQTNVEVRSASGAAVANDMVLATGMTVCMMNGTTVLREYSIAVTGDVNADGEATTIDARTILMAVLDKRELNELLTAAYDYDGNGEINTTDVRLLLVATIG